MKIEFECVPRKMEELRGYCRMVGDPEKNPYRAAELIDEEYCFISGMNYVLSYILENAMEMDVEEAEGSLLGQLKQEIGREALERLKEMGDSEMRMILTGFIDSHYDPESD